MVLIAIAGGTSPTLGHSIATAINSSSSKSNNTALILSSRPTPANSPTEIRQVNYSSLPSLTSALLGIHTVISVLKIPGPEAIEYETNLLHAAKEAGVKRFAPAAFENGPLATSRVSILSLAKPAVWQACLDSGLEVARFSGGMFMNYLALGSGVAEAEQGLVDEVVYWDVANGKAELPVTDDGTFPRLTMTSLKDVGRFVAAACELPEGCWRGSMQMVGQTIRVDEVTKAVEEVMGREMEVSTVGSPELQRRVDAVEAFGSTREEIFSKMIAEISLLVLEEKEDMCVLRPVVNELCPDVQPMGVREMVQLAWGKGK